MNEFTGFQIPPKVMALSDIRLIDKVLLSMLADRLENKVVKVEYEELAQILKVSKTYVAKRLKKLIKMSFMRRTLAIRLEYEFTEKGEQLLDFPPYVLQTKSGNEILEKEPTEKDISLKEQEEKTEILKKNIKKKMVDSNQRDLFGGYKPIRKDVESTVQNQLFVFANNKLEEFGFSNLVIKTFSQFLSNYLTIRKTPTIPQVKILVEKINGFKTVGYSEEEVCEVINHSILKNYSDLYELKNINERRLKNKQVGSKRKTIKTGGEQF